LLEYEVDIMEQKLQKNYIESYNHTIKLDNETWQYIKEFFMDNYSEQLIVITLEEEDAQEYTDFDSAKDAIIKADNKIRKISLFAGHGEEDIKIDYVNGMWTKVPAMCAEAMHSKQNENMIKQFLESLKEKGKAEHINLYNYMLTGAYLFFLLCSFYNWLDSFDVTLIMFITMVPLIIINAAYCEIAWGRKRIIFWLDEDKKKDTIKKVKMMKGVMYFSYGAMLVYMVGNIFF